MWHGRCANRKIIPHIPSNDIVVTKEFFTNLFGFKVRTDTENYVSLINKNSTLEILKSLNSPNEQSVYFQVFGIEKIWGNLKNKINKYKELFIQDYGMKEFHIIVPKTATLLFVGEPNHA